MRAQALAEDASVFDYDGVYDEMKTEREKKALEQKEKRHADKEKPKYIGTLLQQAKIREVENERIRERRLLRERQADDALYGDKEKLVSASYKRKLKEMQNWDAEDARLAALEEREDVMKQGEHAMASFYANLNKNIAMGGTMTNARSAYTVKEAQSAQVMRGEPTRAEQGGGGGVDGPDSESVKACHEVEAEKPSGTESLDDNQTVSVRNALPLQEEIDATTDTRAPPQCIQEEAKPSKEDAIAAARARFLARKAQRKSSSCQQ